MTPATAEVQASPDMAGSAVEGVMHPIGNTVDTRTVWPQTLFSVENEGPIGGLLCEDLDKGPQNAKGLRSSPPDINDEPPEPQGDIALCEGPDNTDLRESLGSNLGDDKVDMSYDMHEGPMANLSSCKEKLKKIKLDNRYCNFATLQLCNLATLQLIVCFQYLQICNICLRDFLISVFRDFFDKGLRDFFY